MTGFTRNRHPLAAVCFILSATVLFPPSACGCPCKYCGPTTLCHQMGLLEVPYTLPAKDVTRLLLHGNLISRLGANEFRGLFRVTELDLHANKIGPIDRDAFAGLESLESLHLSDNEIDYVPNGALLNLPKLSRLFLDKNRLKTLPADVPRVSGLTKLNLGGNRMSSIPWTSFISLKQMESVILWSNPLSCDCNTLELIKWFRTSSRGSAISSDIGTYNCTRKGTKKTCKELEIVEVTHIRDNSTAALSAKSPSSATYVQSDSAALHCKVTGDPPPLIVWRTPSAGYVYPHSRGRSIAFPNGTLAIRNLRVSDSGDYTCYPQLVDVTDLTSSSLQVKVVRGVKPRITHSFDKIQAYREMEVELQCKAAGNPTPLIEWYSPYAISPLSEANFTGGQRKFAQSEGGAKLTIEDFSEKDAGLWKCRASNSMGFDAAYTQITYTEKDDNLILILIITACVVVAGVIAVVVVVTCIIARKRRQRSRGESAKETPRAKVANCETPEGETNRSYQPETLREPRNDILQQPYTQVPEIKGIRI